MNADTTTREAAETRVSNTPELEEYRDLLVEYDWNAEEGEQEKWVATAPITEIVGWAKAVRRNEDAE